MRVSARSILLVVSVVALASPGSAHSQDTSAVRTQVDQIFKAFTPATPGCAVGADVKGQPVVRALYGMADTGARRR